jgi:hypothetical protein
VPTNGAPEEATPLERLESYSRKAVSSRLSPQSTLMDNDDYPRAAGNVSSNSVAQDLLQTRDALRRTTNGRALPVTAPSTPHAGALLLGITLTIR